ncbi:cation transporter [Pseudanabaena sp. FACHB-2040]|nr:cation diffusion facilitator family transporter [Pseudanabaena sp. FACHB-2040]MBD2258869.1 cation transporter [Pseudanabaena sp. FACHB-2040]
MIAVWHSCNSPQCASPASLVADQRRPLRRLLILVMGFAAIEWVVGGFSHSLALQSDAGHMLADGWAIILALTASWLTRLMLARKSAGRPRLDVASALINSFGLLVMAGLISWEAVKHLIAPPQAIFSEPMLITAIIGLVINGLGVWMLHGENHQDLNVRGAFLHVLADLASSVGVIAGAIAISTFHWFWLDGAISLTVALLIGGSAIPLIRQSIRSLQITQPSLQELGLLEIGSTDLEALLTARNRT